MANFRDFWQIFHWIHWDFLVIFQGFPIFQDFKGFLADFWDFRLFNAILWDFCHFFGIIFQDFIGFFKIFGKFSGFLAIKCNLWDMLPFFGDNILGFHWIQWNLLPILEDFW